MANMQDPHTNESGVLDQLGLHHLRALDAILEVGSVTRAASRLGLSQSALSHQLARLREVLGDPLVVRGSGGVVPTPRAQELASPLRRALVELEQAMTPSAAWDPGSAVRRFRVAMPEHYAPLLLGAVLRRLATVAPGIDLAMCPVALGDAARALEEGAVELAVTGLKWAAAGLKGRALLTDELGCATRQGHPSSSAPLDLETFCELDHLLISPSGATTGIVDTHLAAIGRSRRVRATTPSFLAAPLIVAESDLILTAPRRLLSFMARHVPLDVLDAPPALSLPPFRMGMVWHPRMHHDDGHRWLRAVFAETF